VTFGNPGTEALAGLRKGDWVGVTRLAIFVLVLMTACAGQQPRSQYVERDIRRDEILMLDGKIMDYRRELGLEPRPSAWLIQMHRSGPTVASLPEEEDKGNVCTTVCDLAEYICGAQQDICRIAGDLGDDEWARAKCDSAKASCAEAKKRCVECRASDD